MQPNSNDILKLPVLNTGISQRKQRVLDVIASRQQGAVIVECINNPYNAIALSRSCDAFGLQELYVILKDEKIRRPNKFGVKAAMGANKWLNIHIYQSTNHCIDDVKEKGYEVLATVLDNEAESIYSVNLTVPKLALLLGNEAHGLSEEAISLSDRMVTIPMRGMVSCLNLYAAASIFLYEMTRQRQRLGLENYTLDNQHRSDLTDKLLNRANINH